LNRSGPNGAYRVVFWIQPLAHRNAALEQEGADLVDHTGALAN
jgi:hypothetical protein